MVRCFYRDIQMRAQRFSSEYLRRKIRQNAVGGASCCSSGLFKYPGFHLDDDTYESPDHWKTFNDFFSRRLRDASKRPIAFPEDDHVVTAPADSVPHGLWMIDENSRVSADAGEQAGITIKTGTLTDVSVLLGNSRYSSAFGGSDIVMIFSQSLAFEMTAAENEHLLMGQPYGRIGSGE